MTLLPHLKSSLVQEEVVNWFDYTVGMLIGFGLGFLAIMLIFDSQYGYIVDQKDPQGIYMKYEDTLYLASPIHQ